jgi:hypothetical protein
MNGMDLCVNLKIKIMNWENFIKFLIIIILISVDIYLFDLWYNTFILGQYFLHATFFLNVMVGFVCPVSIISFSYLAIKSIIKSQIII